MNILFLGDIVGQIGIRAVSEALPSLKQKEGIDFVIANGENASRGKGLVYRDYRDLCEAGIDCITLGNHYLGKKQINSFIDEANNLIRPINVRGYHKGEGSRLFLVGGIPVRVTNVLGQVFMTEEVEDPIPTIRHLLDSVEPTIHIVDFHAEATSEKQAIARYFDGRITALLGTHTHCQTADARVLAKGTGLITDVGFCGAYESILGDEPEDSIRRFFLHDHSVSLHVPESGPTLISGVVVSVDTETKHCAKIKPLYLYEGGPA